MGKMRYTMTIRQWFNHKIRYPGSQSFYTVELTIGANAHSKQEVAEMVEEILPGLDKYLLDKGFVRTRSKGIRR